MGFVRNVLNSKVKFQSQESRDSLSNYPKGIFLIQKTKALSPTFFTISVSSGQSTAYSYLTTPLLGKSLNLLEVFH